MNKIESTPPGELLPLPYEISEEVENIAKKVLNSLTIHAKIAYVASKKNSRWLGKCQLVPAVFKLLTGLDYIIYINAEEWGDLSTRQREALVFHELEHIGWKENAKDPEFGKWATRRHDIEEFSSVVNKYGRWWPDVAMFNESLKDFDNNFDENGKEIISKETGEVFYGEVEKIADQTPIEEHTGQTKVFKLAVGI